MNFLEDIKKRKTLTIVAGISFFTLFVLGLVCYAIKENELAISDEFQTNYYDNTLTSPYIPEALSFAGETVPIDVYWVRESLDRELIGVCYQHSLTLQTFKLAGRWLPEIERIMKEEGLFVYIPKVKKMIMK